MVGARMPRPGTAIQAACLVPLAIWGWRMAAGALGANPIEASIRMSGEWTLWFLIACLAVTPVRRLFDLPHLAPLRRTFGLFSFFYGVLHVVGYAAVDQALDVGAIVADATKRVHIAVGVAAFLLMVPLAATSARRAVARIGARRWRLLHRAVYAVAVLAVVHVGLLVKGRSPDPWLYGVAVCVLLLARGPVAQVRVIRPVVQRLVPIMRRHPHDLSRRTAR